MITLAFDTCLDKMYVTLRKAGKAVTSKTVENHDNKYHSAFLISTLKEILRENNIEPKDIDLIGVNIGPGSFTGIRACVTVARVMAQLLNCKAVGISSLEILAKANMQLRSYAAKSKTDDQSLREQEVKFYNDCVISENLQEQLNANSLPSCPPDLLSSLVALDARKNCAYLFVDNEIKGAVQLETVKELIDNGKYNVITDDKLQPILGGESYQQKELPLGEILAELAEEKAMQDECNWRLLKPLYIQPPPMG